MSAARSRGKARGVLAFPAVSAMVAVAMAVAAGCSSGPPAVGARFAGPAAMVPFSGVTSKRAGVSPYFAVASARGDELRLIDQYDLIVVVGPGLVFPLAVPTAEHPVLLASAALGDGGADVLCAVSTGFKSLQVVDTWSGAGRIAYQVPLEGVLAPDGQVVAMVGIPARAAAGPLAAVPARIVLAVNDTDLAAGLLGPSTGKLVVVELDRASDGSGGVTARAVDPAANVKALGFRAADLALEPPGLPAADGTRVPGTHLYIASKDPILATGGAAALGVGSVDVSASQPSLWTVAALDARAPTLAVAAGWVDERLVEAGNFCSPHRFQGAPRLQIVAALDPAGCGPTEGIACGLATLDPATGALAADPAARVVLPPDPVPGDAIEVPVQPFRQPMPIPGVPSHVTILAAPATGSPPQRLLTETDGSVPSTDCPTVGTGVYPLFRIYPGSGPRYTSALAVVTSTDGRSYWYDLARWAPASDVQTVVNGSTRVQVTAASASGSSRLGVWSDQAAGPNVVSDTTDTTTFLASIQVWPGFTDSDAWSVVFQGALPQLALRPATLATAGGAIYAAAQRDAGNAFPLTDARRWAVPVRVADPALGVRPGDTVELLDGSGAIACATSVAAVLSPAEASLASSLAMPGGALQLAAGPGDVPAGCAAALAGGTPNQSLRFTVRAPGFVLSSSKLGYLGRPELSDSPDPADKRFAVAWADEAVLSQDTSRAGQEALALARKARRLFYPVQGPCPPVNPAFDQTSSRVGCYYGYPRLADPLQPGPIIRFRLGLLAGSPAPVRGDAIVFTTQRGFVHTWRAPIVGGAVPAEVLPFDWGAVNRADHGDDPIRYLVPYLDDQVVGYGPGGNVRDFYIR